MRRFPIELFIVAVAVVMLILGWRIYGAGEMGRFGPAVHAQKAPSELYARLLIRYPKPPVFEEEYRMSDIEGVSKFDYRVRGYNGRQITVKAPAARVYDVSFFLGRLDQDGIWDLVDKPPRPDVDAFYTVYVKQLADYKQGQRTVTFTNPKYWAAKVGTRVRDQSLQRRSQRFCGLAGAASRRRALPADRRRFSQLRPRRVPAATSPPRRRRFAVSGVDRRASPPGRARCLAARRAGASRVFEFYEVAESPGNQLFGKTLVSGPKGERVVALTYDDGPNPPYTDQILEVLREENVHATFFVVGRAVQAYPAVVRREVDGGNAVGNHTWSHGHLVLYGTDGLRRTLRAHRSRHLRRGRRSQQDHASAVRRTRLARAR